MDITLTGNDGTQYGFERLGLSMSAEPQFDRPGVYAFAKRDDDGWLLPIAIDQTLTLTDVGALSIMGVAVEKGANCLLWRADRQTRKDGRQSSTTYATTLARPRQLRALAPPERYPCSPRRKADQGARRGLHHRGRRWRGHRGALELVIDRTFQNHCEVRDSIATRRNAT
jgi:hypothetical protein